MRSRKTITRGNCKIWTETGFVHPSEMRRFANAFYSRHPSLCIDALKARLQIQTVSNESVSFRNRSITDKLVRQKVRHPFIHRNGQANLHWIGAVPIQERQSDF